MHVIQETFKSEMRLHQAELSWQTQMMCSFISMTVEDSRSREKLFAAAMKLTLLDDDEQESFEVDTTPEERTLEDIIENGSVQQALERNNRRTGPGLPFK
jgi:hypothetical protein